MGKHKEVTCLACGWVAFEYPRAEAINAVRRFNEWYDSQREDVKRNYIPWKLRNASSEEIRWERYHSKIENYEHCTYCGGSYRNFRDAKKEDSPYGCTLNPIIPRNE